MGFIFLFVHVCSNLNSKHTGIYISAYLQLSYRVYCTDMIKQIYRNGRTLITNKTELHLIHLSCSKEMVGRICGLPIHVGKNRNDRL